MTSPESISTPDLSNCGQGYETRSPVEFVKTVLKPQVGNTEEFLEFERYFYYQTEELNSVKKAFAELQTMISKLQEGKRSMELQLVSEKSLRDQESRNSLMEIEKLTVQCNAQIYSIKCEAETWKRKAEAATTEATWLKDQMKNVEMEKNLAANKLNELKSNLVNFEQHRKSFEFFYARERELMKNFNQKLDELEHAKVILEKIIDSNQKQLDLVSVHLRDWQEEREKSKKKIAELEDLLMSARAEIEQLKVGTSGNEDGKDEEVGGEVSC